MKESDTLEILQKRKTKLDKIVNGLKITLGVYAFGVLTFLAVQGIVAQQQIANVLKEVEATTQAVRDSQLANQKTGTDNHEKTRAYIKCLFTEVLTVPVAQRTNIDLDSCTKKVDEQAETDTKADTPSNQQSSVMPQSTQSNPKPTEPVAAAPPDPEETPDDRSALGKLPIVGGLLDSLGL